jgi:hypothetical protein
MRSVCAAAMIPVLVILSGIFAGLTLGCKYCSVLVATEMLLRSSHLSKILWPIMTILDCRHVTGYDPVERTRQEWISKAAEDGETSPSHQERRTRSPHHSPPRQHDRFVLSHSSRDITLTQEMQSTRLFQSSPTEFLEEVYKPSSSRPSS